MATQGILGPGLGTKKDEVFLKIIGVNSGNKFGGFLKI
jgi:hypothetical protein